ncbi:MAG: 4-hydroxy-tetrahydrodipicolinate synthase [Clostridia bacterium]|nr:4-hydroxy-tetrahydrodipicolinate synthase [Clostridia bacterium]
MSKKTIFKGIATALVTPMTEQGIDYENFAKLVEFQISSGIDALVVCGTTGEASTLTDEEHRDAIAFVVKQTAGRVPVIAGTGSNDTAYAIELSTHAKEAGADALLLVTPYYNKATQKGLVRMFTEITDAVDLPAILYNVPSRTGCNMLPKTYRELAENPRIVAVKEAGGNISAVAETINLCGDMLDVYSGNDDQIVPIMSLGGIGGISVLSNLMPYETAKMARLYLEGNVKESAAMQIDFIPLINALFCEVNPIPAKAAMAKMGYCGSYLRSPLTEMEDVNKEKLFALMKGHKLI